MSEPGGPKEGGLERMSDTQAFAVLRDLKDAGTPLEKLRENPDFVRWISENEAAREADPTHMGEIDWVVRRVGIYFDAGYVEEARDDFALSFYGPYSSLSGQGLIDEAPEIRKRVDELGAKIGVTFEAAAERAQRLLGSGDEFL